MNFLGPTVISLDGPLTLDKAEIRCPKCGTGQLKAIMSPRSKGGGAMVICSSKKAHAWEAAQLPAGVVTSLKPTPAGSFALKLPDGKTLSGKVKATGQAAANKGKPAGAPAQHSPAVQAAAAARGGRGGGGGGGALVEALRAVSAVAGAVGQVAGAVGQTAGAVGQTASSVAGVAKEGLGVAREGIKAADSESGRWHLRWMVKNDPEAPK